MHLKDFDYRVWDEKSKQYRNNILLFNNKFVEYQNNYHFENYKKIQQDDFFTLELWTGKYDENKHKIFEGDIVLFSYCGGHTSCAVVYDKDTSKFFLINKNEHVDIKKSFDYTPTEIEIIGNVHVNPDSLKEYW